MFTVISSNDHSLRKSSANSLFKGACSYYHYLCDGVDDRNWGCGYRTLQSICSWITSNKKYKLLSVPSIREIQEILVKLEDKPNSFISSRDWIGSFEVCLVIDHIFNVPCKIIHLKSGSDISSIALTLEEHFKTIGSPIMMGGNVDCSSKGVFGVEVINGNTSLLIVDPHYVGKQLSIEGLMEKGWIKWMPLDDFLQSSFYNLCLPLLKS